MKKLYPIFFLAAFLFVMPLKSNAQVRTQDSMALVDLYNATGGPTWTNHTNWLTASPVSTWFGVKVKNDWVDSLDLNRNNLTSRLPSSIGNLTKIRYLIFKYNQLRGGIPKSIGNLTKMLVLDLSYNHLGSFIPNQIGKCASLTILNLEANHLVDTIPPGFGSLVNLTSFYAAGNKIAGRIPDTIGNLKNLSIIDVNYNQFTGMSEAITKCENLIYLDVSYNPLTGNLPANIGNCKKLLYINLNFTQLTGSLPVSIVNCTDLKEIYANSVPLTGSLPADFGNLINLEQVYFNNNKFTGSIPASIVNCTQLNGLTLRYNQFTGSIPATIGNLTQLAYLNLENNQLSGSIPSSIGNCSGLGYLFMGKNQLTGSIPTTIGNLPGLREMDLGKNKLTGTIPSSFANQIDHFQLLSVYDNELTGTFPTPPFKVYALINIEYNRYNFSSVEHLSTRYDDFRYVPQKSIPIHRTGAKLSVTAGGTLSNNTYKWYKNGLLVKTATGDSVYTITTAGSYYATVINALVADLTLQSDTLEVTSLGWASFISGDEFSISQPAFKLYPNPAKDIIIISMANAGYGGNTVIKIYDNNGKMIKQQNGKLPCTLNISTLAAGIYYAEINREGAITKQQFVKQ